MAGKHEHTPRRVAWNQWDDVTECADCGDVLQVHPNVRSKNPNFPAKKGR